MTKVRNPVVGDVKVVRSLRSALILVMTLALTACSGRAASGATSQIVLPAVTSLSPAAATPAAVTVQDKQVPVELRYVLPAASSNTQSQSNANRSLKYISSANTQLTISVTPVGGSTTVYGPTGCTPSACTVGFTATSGPNTISFSLTDNSANVLSTFNTTVIIASSGTNTLNFTANPVVNSVSLALAMPTLNGGTAANDLLTVNAMDIAGNTIVGSGNYVDANGNPLVLTLSVSNTQAGGKGTVSIKGSPRITAPGQAAIYAAYDGKWLQSSTISVNSSRALAGSLSSTTLTTIPTAIEYTVAGGVQGLVTGPDGYIWFTQFGANALGKIRPDGSGLQQYSCGGCNGTEYVTVGSDGNMWTTSLYPGGTTIKMSTAGTILGSYAKSCASTNIISGPDGNIWINCEKTAIGGVIRITPNGTQTLFVAPGNDNVGGLAFAPDGNLWFIDLDASTLGRMRPDGTFLSAFPITNTNIGYCNPACNDGLIVGSDGNLWVTGNANPVVQKVTLSGTVTPYAKFATAWTRRIGNGPDGYIWITDVNAHTLQRISTAGSNLTTYNTVNNIPANSVITDVITGPDGNIWFADAGTNAIGKFVL